MLSNFFPVLRMVAMYLNKCEQMPQNFTQDNQRTEQPELMSCACIFTNLFPVHEN